MKIRNVLLAFALAATAVFAGGEEAVAQEVAQTKNRLASGAERVTVSEQGDVTQAVRSAEQRTKLTKVNGYTILILSDNTQNARENATQAKKTFEENFPDVEAKMYYESPSFYVSVGRYLTKEEAIIELWRIRSVFPKAISQSREMDIEDFIIRPAEQTEQTESSSTQE